MEQLHADFTPKTPTLKAPKKTHIHRSLASNQGLQLSREGVSIIRLQTKACEYTDAGRQKL